MLVKLAKNRLIRSFFLSIITLSLLLFCASSGSASVYQLTTTFVNPTPTENDFFGSSVVINGDRIVIGAANDDSRRAIGGSAYLFEAETGELLEVFNNPTPTDGFLSTLSSLSLSSDNKILIGSLYDDIKVENSGAAYLFEATTGEFLQAFVNPQPTERDYFGSSVAIEGDRILIGAYRDNTEAEDSGAAYLFEATTGELLQTFVNPKPSEGDHFGTSIAISGDRVVIGAPGDDPIVKNSGAVYLFNATTGKLLRTFANPRPGEDDYFGTSIAISGDRILIGSHRDGYKDRVKVKNSGAAYLFEVTTGKLLQIFLNPTPGEEDYFGSSLAISGDRLLIGAYRDNRGGKNSGAVYLFDAATGQLLQTFLNPTPNANDLFGKSVAISGDRIVIGADSDDEIARNSGVAYLFKFNNTTEN